MSDTKHTSGPWRLGGPYRLTVETGVGDVVAMISVYPHGRDANAALIAAAPDLLAACEAVTRRVPVMGSRGDYRDGQLHALEACRDVVRAAIEKARKP